MRRMFLVCLLLLAPPAWAASDFTDGVWLTTGYGHAYAISGGHLQRFEITAISCQKSVSAERVTASGNAARFVGSSINSDTGVTDAFVFRPGQRPHELVLTVDGAATQTELTRSDTLPATCSQTASTDALVNFDIFARTFAEQYPLFAQHRVDWAAVTARHRAAISSSTDEQTLFAHFREMLAPLEDAHVWVEAPALGQEFSGWRPPLARSEAIHQKSLAIVEKRFLATPLAWYCNRQLAFGMLPDGIGYLLIVSFENYDRNAETAVQTAALDAALDDIFGKAPGLRGLVVDIRFNGGGTEMLGLQIAARLTTRPYPASSKIFRIDPVDSTKFSKPQPIMVTPSGRSGFYGPMVLLMGHDSVSAAEAFAMSLQGRTPEPVFIGENTQGVFSDVLIRHLPNGWRFGVPNEIYLNEDKQAYDVAGIPPDVPVPLFTDADLEAGRDPALRTAMRAIDEAALADRFPSHSNR
ncbi:S41 family peptidase [Labrys sp. LIt4]|uniref:S41 family peptidase n=1 Tax=Labrys sp. LIt4 TaxID=2821355 RepID=UPI001AE0A800|nr:S41 family peptidase [Labrys sp. LIt4]MBP0580927.1 S41 family peptidase [Labrys sp. LIt4]